MFSYFKSLKLPRMKKPKYFNISTISTPTEILSMYDYFKFKLSYTDITNSIVPEASAITYDCNASFFLRKSKVLYKSTTDNSFKFVLIPNHSECKQWIEDIFFDILKQRIDQFLASKHPNSTDPTFSLEIRQPDYITLQCFSELSIA